MILRFIGACLLNTNVIIIIILWNMHGSILTVFRYSEHPRFWHGLPRLMALESDRVTKILLKLGLDFYGIPLLRSRQTCHTMSSFSTHIIVVDSEDSTVPLYQK